MISEKRREKIKEDISNQVHEHRVCREKIFQLLVKTQALQKCTVEDLSNLSERLYVLIANELYNEYTYERKRTIDDKEANRSLFVVDLITNGLYKTDK